MTGAGKTVGSHPRNGRRGSAHVIRLGWVEAAILDQVRRRGGAIARRALVDRIFTEVGPRPPAVGGAATRRRFERWKVLRAYSESTLSRAIRSLRRKGLVVVEHDSVAGVTVIRESGLTDLAPWEQAARSDSEIARLCLALAEQLHQLAVRARHRAIAVRAAGTDVGTARARAEDLAALRELGVNLP